jgi:RNA polymerase sigma factor (sigma-70 family)
MYVDHRDALLALLRAMRARDVENMAHDVLVMGAEHLWYPQDPTKIPALLAVIAVRHVKNERRASFRHPHVLLEADALADAHPGQEEALDLAQGMRALDAAFEDMPAEQATLVEEVDLDGASPAEIAEDTGDDHATVRKRLSRARARLRDLVLRRLGKKRE